MFGASVSELYLLIKLLITVDLCVITKKKNEVSRGPVTGRCMQS